MTQGTIIDARLHPPPASLKADVVVCGSGAGGSMAARELARRGLRVIMLEAGADHTPDQFTQREDEMFPALFRDMGGQRSDNLAVLILSGQGLGGSTVHNTNLCKRLSPETLAEWKHTFGLDWATPDVINPIFDMVERDLGVVAIHPSQINANNRVFERGMRALGYRGGLLHHNRDAQCIGSGFCELGCAYDGKLNARRVLVPQALDAGATIYTHARVTRLQLNRDRRGVTGVMLHNGTVIQASVVCLAGSAIGSAELALQSDLPDPHDQLGRHLHIHPAATVGGVFDEPLESWRGIPQSIECTQFTDRGVWLVPSFAHPVGTASMLPGFGPELFTKLTAYPHMAAVAAMVHDDTEGRVYRRFGRSKISYVPTETDREKLALGALEAARILLAAGARQIFVPAVPAIETLDDISPARFAPHDAKLTAVHPMGTMRMGADPRVSVVTPRGEHHQVRGLYVTDGSLFPTSLGGPPQLPIYALAALVARGIT